MKYGHEYDVATFIAATHCNNLSAKSLDTQQWELGATTGFASVRLRFAGASRTTEASRGVCKLDKTNLCRWYNESRQHNWLSKVLSTVYSVHIMSSIHTLILRKSVGETENYTGDPVISIRTVWLDTQRSDRPLLRWHIRPPGEGLYAGRGSYPSQ